MKSKDKKELKTRSSKELKSMLISEKAELFTLKMDLSRNKLKNTSLISQKRKNIAQIQTALSEQALLNINTKGDLTNNK